MPACQGFATEGTVGGSGWFVWLVDECVESQAGLDGIEHADSSVSEEAITIPATAVR